jgi:gentisate 1,2-dioxygenase
MTVLDWLLDSDPARSTHRASRTRCCGSHGATCSAFGELAAVTPRDETVQLAYFNPETGRECLAALGFSALQLRPGEELQLPRRSASAILHVVEVSGTALVDEAKHQFETADTLGVPTHADVRIANGSSKALAYLFVVDDAPLQRKLGIYESHSCIGR